MKKLKRIGIYLIDLTGVPAYWLGYLTELNKDAFKLGKNNYNQTK